MEAIVFIILQIFFATREVLKIGEHLTIRLLALVFYEQIANEAQPQMEAIVFIILQIFLATREVLKIGEYLTITLLALVFYEQIVNEAQPS